MRVEVRLIYQKGRKVSLPLRKVAPRFRGNLMLGEELVQPLGRTTFVAKLTSDENRMSLLPQLHDAAVVHVKEGRMRIRGFEVIEEIHLGQTWDIKVLPC